MIRKPERPIKTAPGWAPAIPPYITYPVANVAWGNMETPPYALAKFHVKGEAPPPPPPPSMPPAAPNAPMIPPTGPLNMSDWFGVLR